jgi:hypothetical protein
MKRVKTVAWRALKVVTWWILKIVSGLATIVGVITVGWQSVAFYYLLTGRVQPDMDQPPIEVVAMLLVIGMVLLIGGYKGPKWLNIDRLL